MSRVQAVNLLSPARLAARHRRRRIRSWVVGVGMYAALLVAIWMGARVLTGGAGQTLASQIDRTERRITQSKQRMAALQPKLAEARTTLAASRAVGEQPDWSLLLGLLSKLLDERTVLTNCRLEPLDDAPRTAEGPYRLHISGMGRTQVAVSAYMLRLEESGLFDKVTLVDTQTEPFRQGEAVGFRIECRLGASQTQPRATEPSAQEASQ